LDQARLLFTALGRRPDIYLSTLFCAIAAAAPQDTAAGRNAAALLTAMAAERGGDWSHEWALWVTALSMRHTDPAGAAEKLRAALRLGVPIGDLWGVGWGIEVLSWVTAARGDHLHAARLFGAADRNWEVFGLDLGALIPLGRERRRWQQQVRRALSERDYDNAYRAGLALDRAAAIDLALADDAPAQPALTRREMEVAELVRAGLTNRQIASQLRLSPRTVETHLAHIQAKLGVPNRAAIAAWHAQSTG
jgi:non-specific serine/threonine protein kinase